MSDFIQVVSQQGYKVHAVSNKAQRYGSFDRLVGTRPPCGLVAGRDSWAMPTLMIQFEGNMVRANPRPFKAGEFTEKQDVCQACLKAVGEAS